MPKLKKIVVQDFRNIVLQELEFSGNVNCITGGNGEGKTNLLDAIHYLSMTRSAFAGSDKFLFRYGCKSFSLSGLYELPSGVDTRISIQVSDGSEKKIRRDDKPCRKASELIGTVPVVTVSPADSSLVSDSGEDRRRFVNAVLSQMDKTYLANAQQYNRLLLQRNTLLKEGNADPALLDVFDQRLDAIATPIFHSREEFCVSLLPIVQKYYSDISGGREEVGIEYRSDLQKAPLAESLRAHRERDFILKFTGNGVQRDDFLFTMDSHPIRKCGSQGQQKSFLVALKFAQYELMKSRVGFAPVLLLDDLFDKLDFDRVGNLLNMVAGSEFGQIFITDTDKSRTGALVDSITTDRRHFEAHAGKFTAADGKE